MLLGLWINTDFLKKRFSWFGVKEEDIQDIADTTFREPTFARRKLQIVPHQKKIFTFTTILLIVGAMAGTIVKSNRGNDLRTGCSSGGLVDGDISEAEVHVDRELL